MCQLWCIVCSANVKYDTFHEWLQAKEWKNFLLFLSATKTWCSLFFGDWVVKEAHRKFSWWLTVLLARATHFFYSVSLLRYKLRGARNAVSTIMHSAGTKLLLILRRVFVSGQLNVRLSIICTRFQYYTFNTITKHNLSWLGRIIDASVMILLWSVETMGNCYHYICFSVKFNKRKW